MTVFVEVIKSILKDLRRGWKQFLKKRLFFRWKTTLAKFFSYYWILQISSNIFLGARKFSGNPFASYKNISVTPRRLFKTESFENKSLFFKRKFYLGQKVRVKLSMKPHWTVHKSSQCSVTVIFYGKRSFLKALRVRWKQFLKRSLFSRWKTSLAKFFSYYPVRQTSGNVLLGYTKYFCNPCAS